MTFKDRLRSLSVVDAAAVLVVVAAAGGVLWSPKLSNTVALAFNASMPILNDQRLYQRAAQLQALYEIEFVDFLRDLMRYNAMA